MTEAQETGGYRQGYIDGRKQLFIEIGWALAFQRDDEICGCAGHVMARQFLDQLRGYQAEDRAFDAASALALHNAQGEIDNAIANVFVHFPLPGGIRGRFHDTLCGESVHWRHMASFRDGEAEGESAAKGRVTCPVCLENLNSLGNGNGE